MGSPYFVHSFSNVSVIRSARGLVRAVDKAMTSAGSHWRFTSLMDNLGSIDQRYDCETQLFRDIMNKVSEAIKNRSRVCLFLEPRYEWAGWEKFQVALVLDFTDSPLRRTAGVEELRNLSYNYDLVAIAD